MDRFTAIGNIDDGIQGLVSVKLAVRLDKPGERKPDRDPGNGLRSAVSKARIASSFNRRKSKMSHAIEGLFLDRISDSALFRAAREQQMDMSVSPPV
jgi:hypothetical protein